MFFWKLYVRVWFTEADRWKARSCFAGADTEEMCDFGKRINKLKPLNRGRLLLYWHCTTLCCSSPVFVGLLWSSLVSGGLHWSSVAIQHVAVLASSLVFPGPYFVERNSPKPFTWHYWVILAVSTDMCLFSGALQFLLDHAITTNLCLVFPLNWTAGIWTTVESPQTNYN